MPVPGTGMMIDCELCMNDQKITTAMKRSSVRAMSVCRLILSLLCLAAVVVEVGCILEMMWQSVALKRLP